jgi:carbonic anhydrase
MSSTRELHKATFTADVQASVDADKALELLKYGNEQYLKKSGGIKRDYQEQRAATAGGQWPHSVVLSCIDSRVPAEIVFNQGVGDIFSARVAGNVVDEDMLGSIEYACRVAGSKLVVVLGHTGCGAVKAACDHVQLGNITKLLGKILPAVALTPLTKGDTRSSKNKDFVNDVVRSNVNLSIQRLRNESWILAGMEKAGEIKIVGAVYDVASGEVDFMVYTPPIMYGI